MSESDQQPQPTAQQPSNREQTEALLRLKKQRLAKALVEGDEPSAAELTAVVNLEGRLANMDAFERLRDLTREPAVAQAELAGPVEDAVEAPPKKPRARKAPTKKRRAKPAAVKAVKSRNPRSSRKSTPAAKTQPVDPAPVVLAELEPVVEMPPPAARPLPGTLTR